METPELADVRCVLILKTDRIYAEALRQHTLSVIPHARVILVQNMEAARLTLTSEPVDLFVTGACASLESDVLDLLVHRPSQENTHARRILVVTARREYRVLSALRSLAVEGVFDSSGEGSEQFIDALRIVASGGRFWSQSLVDHMQRMGAESTALFRFLTIFEQVVFAVIGDGSDNTTAARTLNLSPATVSTVRRELHRKLGVQHRGELIRIAAQHGFVRFTPTGVVRPAFALMCSAYEARRAKRSKSRPCR